MNAIRALMPSTAGALAASRIARSSAFGSGLGSEPIRPACAIAAVAASATTAATIAVRRRGERVRSRLMGRSFGRGVERVVRAILDRTLRVRRRPIPASGPCGTRDGARARRAGATITRSARLRASIVHSQRRVGDEPVAPADEVADVDERPDQHRAEARDRNAEREADGPGVADHRQRAFVDVAEGAGGRGPRAGGGSCARHGGPAASRPGRAPARRPARPCRRREHLLVSRDGEVLANDQAAGAVQLGRRASAPSGDGSTPAAQITVRAGTRYCSPAPSTMSRPPSSTATAPPLVGRRRRGLRDRARHAPQLVRVAREHGGPASTRAIEASRCRSRGSPAAGCRGRLSDLAGHLDAGRAAADDGEAQPRLPLAGSSRAPPSRTRGGSGCGPPARPERLQAGRQLGPLLAAEIAVRGAGRDDQRVVSERHRLAVRAERVDARAFEVEARDLGEQDPGVGLRAEDAAQRRAIYRSRRGCR